MKLSVSLPDDDVEYLDAYAQANGVGSCSAVVQKALRLLRASELVTAYEEAWQEWVDSGAAEEWEAVDGDGLVDASR